MCKKTTSTIAEKQSKEFNDVIETLYTQGNDIAAKKFSHMYFTIAVTPDNMKVLGIEGDRFTISYGTISRHYDKDTAHYLPKDVWMKLPEAIVKPFAISKYYSDSGHLNMKGYRLYTVIQYDDGYIVAGVTVKNAGRNLKVNSISTIFARDKNLSGKEEVIFIETKITPLQEALLRKPNSSQYQPEKELSGDKVNSSSK
ncbi:MAG: hypothetical protein IK103_04055 [Bacteroidales bacterium]|nr:hypothetical protein [Bacteroidales bacterium]